MNLRPYFAYFLTDQNAVRYCKQTYMWNCTSTLIRDFIACTRTVLNVYRWLLGLNVGRGI